MTLWRVQTDNWVSKEYDSIVLATIDFEQTKESEMEKGVTEESYVELVVSHDNFDDYTVIRRANAVVDEERMEISTPDEEGHDFLWWAKWVEEKV